METLPTLMDALALVLEPARVGWLTLAVVAGILVGVMPGIGGVTGMAILLPFALTLDPVAGLGMMIGVLAATSTADTFAAVLFAIPGSSSSQATILDGHPMAQRGEAGRALGAAFLASLIGGMIGAVILTATITAARPVILTFQSPELFMLGLLGMSMMAVLAGREPIKGLVAAGIGLMIGMIGMDGFTGSVRFTQGSLYLFDGVALTIVALGIFAIPEIINLMVKGTSIADTDIRVHGGVLQGMRDTLHHKFLVLRTAILGLFVGILPGLGGNVVDWFAYGHAKQTEKGAKDTFGTGDVRGVIGVDAATNAKDGGMLVPTLLFGIPGGTPMALLMGMFLIYGIDPGPTMVTRDLDITYSLIWSLVLAQLVVFLLVSTLVNPISRITVIPFHIIAPIILVVITFAAFQSTGATGDLVTLLVLSAFGWAMKYYRWPRPPLVLGLVLSGLLERFLFISVGRYGAGWLTRPIVMIVGVLVLASFVYGGRIMINDHRARRQAVDAETRRDEE